MKKLVALLVGLLAAIGAAATILFFKQRNQGSWSSVWGCAKDTTTSWGETAAREAGKAADGAASAGDGATQEAAKIVDQAKGTISS
jgi:hypothetical protein